MLNWWVEGVEKGEEMWCTTITMYQHTYGVICNYQTSLKYSTSTAFIGHKKWKIFLDVLYYITVKISERETKYRYYKCTNTPNFSPPGVI